MAPIIRNLGGLEGEVKNAGECRGYVGTQGFKGCGKEPIRASSLIGLRDSRALWVSDSVMWGVAMLISVRGWKVGVDPLSVR